MEEILLNDNRTYENTFAQNLSYFEWLTSNSDLMAFYKIDELICPREYYYRTIDGDGLNFDTDYYKINASHIAFQALITVGNVNNSAQEIINILDKLNPKQDAEAYSYDMLRNMIIVFAYSLLVIVSLFGNLLVIFIIMSRGHLRSQTTHKLIGNLTFSDLILTLFNIPLTVVRNLSDSWPFGSTLCMLGPFVQALSVYVSTLSMVMIAIDRHQVLLSSTKTSVRKRFSIAPFSVQSNWTLFLIWTMSIVLSVPYSYFNRVVYKQTYRCLPRCMARYPKPAALYSKTITLFSVTSQYLAPLLIMLICYTQIGMHIWRRVRIGAMTTSQRHSYLKSKKRTIKMLILLVIIFAICWLPLHLYHLYLDFVPNTTYSKFIFLLCHWFGISSVCYNPFIYFWLNRQYKARAKQIFSLCGRSIGTLCFSLNSNDSTGRQLARVQFGECVRDIVDTNTSCELRFVDILQAEKLQNIPDNSQTSSSNRISCTHKSNSRF